MCLRVYKCEVGGQEKPKWKTTWRDKERQRDCQREREGGEVGAGIRKT